MRVRSCIFYRALPIQIFTNLSTVSWISKWRISSLHREFYHRIVLRGLSTFLPVSFGWLLVRIYSCTDQELLILPRNDCTMSVNRVSLYERCGGIFYSDILWLSKGLGFYSSVFVFESLILTYGFPHAREPVEINKYIHVITVIMVIHE